MRTETKYIETQRVADADNEVQESRVFRTDDQQLSGTSTAANAIYTIIGIITGLIAIRFLLLMFGANPQNSIANVVYGITEPFVAPFYGLFGNSYNIDGVRFELESVIAIVFLALLGWAIVKILTISRPQHSI